MSKLIVIAFLFLSGCSFLEPKPVLLETPVVANKPVINPAYPSDKESQDKFYKRDAIKCNERAVQDRISPTDCMKALKWPIE